MGSGKDDWTGSRDYITFDPLLHIVESRKLDQQPDASSSATCTSLISPHLHPPTVITLSSMPFSTDNSCPPALLRIFEICRNKGKSLENRYYGPYNKLLSYCFGDSFDFFVAPQNPLSDGATGDTVDFVVFFIVFDADSRPVLMAEIKDDNCTRNAHFRFEADKQLRRRYDATFDACPLPRLWGLSLLGTSLRIYRGDAATRAITPPYQGRPREDYILPPGFLEGEWNLDILSQEGFDKMKEIVVDITTATAAL